jgi:hypothetical protein
MGNRQLILAGVKGGGAGGSTLANFGPLGTPLPTAAIGVGATLDEDLYDAGWCTEDGLKKAVDEAQQTIKAFGSNAPVRKLVTSSETTFEITFLESGTTPIEIYNRLPLGSIEVDPATGAFDFTEGEPRTEQMCAVFDLADGPNRIRGVVPNLEVTNRKEFNIKASEAVMYGVTLTAYPGDDGVAIHWYYVVDGLKAVTP